MLFYNDECTRNYEENGNWINCVRYLFGRWSNDKDNIPLFLKLATTTWYTLTLDGFELTIANDDSQFLDEVLCNVYNYFDNYQKQNETCEWIFGYMMDVRTDLFLVCISVVCISDYDQIKQKGNALIEKAADSGNVYARLLNALEDGNKKEIVKLRKQVDATLSDDFDVSQEVDSYFVEILTSSVQ